jgi:peptidoglycan hydrolase CwlO-like protein
VDALLTLCDSLGSKNRELMLEVQALRAKVAKMASKQEQARDRLNQIGERIKALEANA